MGHTETQQFTYVNGILHLGEIYYKKCSNDEGEDNVGVGGLAFLVGEWQTCWFVFAAFALVVGITFALVFKPEKK